MMQITHRRPRARQPFSERALLPVLVLVSALLGAGGKRVAHRSELPYGAAGVGVGVGGAAAAQAAGAAAAIPPIDFTRWPAGPAWPPAEAPLLSDGRGRDGAGAGHPGNAGWLLKNPALPVAKFQNVFGAAGGAPEQNTTGALGHQGGSHAAPTQNSPWGRGQTYLGGLGLSRWGRPAPRESLEDKRNKHWKNLGSLWDEAFPTSTSSMMRPSRTRAMVSAVVVGPGGGTGMNGQVYANLRNTPGFSVVDVGKSRSPYDAYPPGWQDGVGPPNLASFAEALAEYLSELPAVPSGDARVLVLGSRGGQVVLPELWRRLGDSTPPAVVINGGCAMTDGVTWPERAATFLLLGGQDYFKGQQPDEDYIIQTLVKIPASSTTTAVLYVEDMSHMPDPQLLDIALTPMLQSLATWQASPDRAPDDLFISLVNQLHRDFRRGYLIWTAGDASLLQLTFGDRVVPFPRVPVHQSQVPVHQVKSRVF